MKFFYSMSMLAPADYVPLVREVERCGFDGVCIPDSICYPRTSDTDYPYNDDGSRDFLAGQPFIEPFALIPLLASASETLRFRTFVYKLPVRNPVLAAKSATSVAVLSGERFDFGVGLSPWQEDYDVCGQQWTQRGRRFEEMIEIIRGLSSGEFYAFKGEFYDILPIQLCPVPSGNLPILIGGHSKAALQRAALMGNGWLHAGGDHDEMVEMVSQIRQLRLNAGKANEPFEIQVGSAKAFKVDGLRQLQDMGVTSVGITFGESYRKAGEGDSMAYTVSQLERYGAEVIDKFRSH